MLQMLTVHLEPKYSWMLFIDIVVGTVIAFPLNIVGRLCFYTCLSVILSMEESIPTSTWAGGCVSQHAPGQGGVYPSMHLAGGCVSQHAPWQRVVWTEVYGQGVWTGDVDRSVWSVGMVYRAFWTGCVWVFDRCTPLVHTSMMATAAGGTYLL